MIGVDLEFNVIKTSGFRYYCNFIGSKKKFNSLPSFDYFYEIKGLWRCEKEAIFLH